MTKLKLCELILEALVNSIPIGYRERGTAEIEFYVKKMFVTVLYIMSKGVKDSFKIRDDYYRTADYNVPTGFAEIAKLTTVFADDAARFVGEPIWKLELTDEEIQSFCVNKEDFRAVDAETGMPLFEDEEGKTPKYKLPKWAITSPDELLLEPDQMETACRKLFTRQFTLPTSTLVKGHVVLTDLSGMISSDGEQFVLQNGGSIPYQLAYALGVTDVIDAKYRKTCSMPTETEVYKWITTLFPGEQQS